MTVKEFIKKAEGADSGDAMSKKINLKHYVPLELKQQVIESALIDKIVHIKDGLATYNSIDKYLAFTTTAITLYTDLLIENPLEDYDSLVSSGYLKAIFDEIGEDYFVFRDLFEMRFEDKIREVNTLEAIVNTGVQGILSSVNSLLNKATDFIDKNPDKLLEIFTKFKD